MFSKRLTARLAIVIFLVGFSAVASAQECLSLPWDKQGNGLAHRRGEWFEQRLALMSPLPQGTSVYRQNGVYVVIGGAGDMRAHAFAIP